MSAHAAHIGYLHVVFTLPCQVLQNKKVIYDLLFRASAETLLELARDPRHLGAEIGFFSVLHVASAVVLLTVPSGARWSYAPVHWSLPEDPVRETPHTPEECLSKAQFFQKVGQILHP